MNITLQSASSSDPLLPYKVIESTLHIHCSQEIKGINMGNSSDLVIFIDKS